MSDMGKSVVFTVVNGATGRQVSARTFSYRGFFRRLHLIDKIFEEKGKPELFSRLIPVIENASSDTVREWRHALIKAMQMVRDRKLRAFIRVLYEALEGFNVGRKPYLVRLVSQTTVRYYLDGTEEGYDIYDRWNVDTVNYLSSGKIATCTTFKLAKFMVDTLNHGDLKRDE